LDALCLIASPRTGTRHLSEVLKNIEGLAPYLDVFDPGRTAGIALNSWPMLRQFTGIQFETTRDPKLVAFAHEKPTQWLEALGRTAAFEGKHFISFRLMEGQLPTDRIQSALMSWPGLRVVMVMRKQIDAYVSWRKAIELGKWQDVDTTDMKVELDADHFAGWLDEQQRWYEMWRDYLNRNYLPSPTVRYELDIDQPPERIVRRFVATAAQVGVTLRAPATMSHKGLVRQDRSTNAFDKVSNWPQFSREIFSRGLERRAFGYPL
jgi:hypothetical protein